MANIAIGDIMSRVKPYLVGGLGGAVAITIIGFSADWVVATGTMERQVQEARVAALAEVCEVNAEKHWADTGKKVAALEGYNNEEREKLAERFTPHIKDFEQISEDVTDHCEEALRPA